MKTLKVFPTENSNIFANEELGAEILSMNDFEALSVVGFEFISIEDL